MAYISFRAGRHIQYTMGLYTDYIAMRLRDTLRYRTGDLPGSREVAEVSLPLLRLARNLQILLATASS